MSVVKENNHDIIIIGGGLAGLVTACLLAPHGYNILLLEQKKYPFNRVCGEYVSMEVYDFLAKENLLPPGHVTGINRLVLTDTNGKLAEVNLESGGFGISRFVFDQYLAGKAKNMGIDLREEEKVRDVQAFGEYAKVLTKNEIFTAPLIIGAYGKRSVLDKKLNRDFIRKRSPFLGVKYHIRYDQDDDIIALHNFKGGYCGISRIEDEKFNLCYLSATKNLKTSGGDIRKMEQSILIENPHLKRIFSKAEFLFEKPEAISEISFASKSLVDQQIINVGDASGMITPLCGNGMAMAIHGAKLLSESIFRNFQKQKLDREHLIHEFSIKWRQTFHNRLKAGRIIQNLFFSNPFSSNLAVVTANHFPKIARQLVKKTHGKKI